MIVSTWSDPVLAEHGYHPDGPYLTEAWTGVAGASVVAVYRLLLARVGTELDLSTLAALIGQGPSKARGVLDRGQRFGLWRAVGDAVEVRTHVPPLTQHQRRRLNPRHPLAIRGPVASVAQGAGPRASVPLADDLVRLPQIREDMEARR